MTADGYVVSEVRVEQWVLAALRMQHGLSLKPRRHRVRRAVRPLARAPQTRSSLWLMLAACGLAFCLL